MSDHDGLHWRHSSFSHGSDQTCVDVAFDGEEVALRDSKDPGGPVLRFTHREWAVFLLGAGNGEFELPDGAHRNAARRSATSSRDSARSSATASRPSHASR